MACVQTAPLRPCQGDVAARDDVSVTSSVALECHSRLILEELSAMVDDEGSDYTSSSDDSDADVDERRARNKGGPEDDREDALLNREVGGGAGGEGLAYKHGCADSELSLDDMLKDSSVSLVRRRDARVVDREVRAGSQMFRSRSMCPSAGGGGAGGFQRTGSALLGRVIRSASGRVLHNHRASSDRVGGAGGAVRAHVVAEKNAAFCHHGHGHGHSHGAPHGTARGGRRPPSSGCRSKTCCVGSAAASTAARSAGRDLLVDFAPRNGGGGNSDRRTAAMATQPGPDRGGSKTNIFQETLDGANFMSLLGAPGGNGGNSANDTAVAAPQRTSLAEVAEASASSLESRFQESLALDDCPTIAE